MRNKTKIYSRLKNALIPIELLNDWKIQLQNVIMFLMNGFFIGYSIYSPMWAQGILGTNATRAGMTQIASSILLLIGTRLTASLMRNIPAKKIVMMGLFSAFLSAISLILATQTSPYWWLMMSGAFEGFGVGLAFTPMQVSIQDGVKSELVNVYTTFGLLFRTLGQTLMASIYGGVLSLRIANLVGQTNGQITVAQMNQLTDHESAIRLPQNLIPEMQKILFESLHSIMLIGFFLIVVAILINVFRKEPLKLLR